jgi:hypothetical protein
MKKQSVLVLSGLLILLFWTIVLSQAQVQDKQREDCLLKNPEFVKVDLLPRQLELNEDPDLLSRPYKTGAKIYFRIQATNTSNNSIALAILDPYFQNRPELLRGGQVVPYREGFDKLLEAKDKDPFSVMPQVVKLDPNEQKLIGFINLNDWYDSIQPGHYQLSIKHRFEPGQDWIESSSITFEVVPKQKIN